MGVLTGSGAHLYEVVDDWPELPEDWVIRDVADVGVDRAGRIYLFTRGDHPIIVVDDGGSVLDTWGDRQTFPNPHAVTMGADDTIWLTDTHDHTVRRCTLDGEILMTLGVPGVPADPMSGRPFHQCTHVAVHPTSGDLYVSDGYGNAAVHRFDSEGRHLDSWGEPGNGPGQFNLPHNLCCDRDGFVYVADRHNARVQVFDPTGSLEAVWTGMALPCGMHIATSGPEDLCYLTELSSTAWASSGDYSFSEHWNRPGMGPRVSIRTLDGTPIAQLCDEGEGEHLGQLIAPHGLAVDARGDIFVGMCSWIAHGAHLDPPREVRAVQRLRRLTNI